ncbi:TonB-dependent receptor [Muricauda sp. 2012CJ35-5]|uniref:TonB-dependent receptor n=1 Tax=Flagellimonas spongiicola TaxID=2942208 RepID=A0ABT0PQ29_9FLAO|nr:TonB-dependent receptor plug domain-containing protein [Allomuricauda spongiicola]MCL6272797.1 TonB-dependent receptor [Allomuricauda spongiicola]
MVLIWTTGVYSQTATVFGRVLDENSQPLPNVNITANDTGGVTDSNGNYLLVIIAETKVELSFTHLGHEAIILEDLILTTNETFEFNPVMKTNLTQIAGVEVTPTGSKKLEGITTIDPVIARKIPGANSGVENVLKLLPGVSFNNELSTQYNVRGGNFDENLVYVNGIEVYRPFLVRSAQQEGLSFINSDMISSLDFSSGGFQAKYGDKLSSVLDITYKIPTAFGLKLNADLLGASTTIESASKNKRFSAISGIRYRNNGLLVNSQQTEGNYNPVFVDVQNYMSFQFSDKFRLGFLGTYAVNDYNNEPQSRQTNFGTLNDPRALVIFYQGKEKSSYESGIAALKGDFLVSEKTKLNLTTSIYHTQEEEFSDIIAAYELGEVDSNLNNESFGEATNSRGVGSQYNRARNQLDALLFAISHGGIHKNNGSTINWGVKYTFEDIRDQLRESEFIDSAGFFIRPFQPAFQNNQPEEPFTGDLVAYDQVQATNFVKTHRFSGHVQFAKQTKLGKHDVYYNLGIRTQLWSANAVGFERSKQSILSPRAQFSIKPYWEKDIVFRAAIGSYQQPPFYRELRDNTGAINPEVKAQKSVHYVLGSEYSFNLWNRPFTLIGEAYYKDMSQINTYTIEDVRVRYAANNDATAYAYGFDFRLTGAFVPGAQSWVSLGYLETKENSNQRGYLSRPTDQRLKFGVLFQDYIPTIPNLKLYLNLIYNTGVPGGSPNYVDPYDFQNRLRDYKRADMGISYIFADRKSQFPEGHWLHRFKEFNVGFEIFNMFNNQNSITNTWVRDVDTQRQFAVPNFLTGRILNLKFGLRF